MGRVPLVPYVSLRLRPAKMASREFSSAHTTATPPEPFWIVADECTGIASSTPRCPPKRSSSTLYDGLPLCESVAAIIPILKGLTPSSCSKSRPSLRILRTYMRSLNAEGGRAPPPALAVAVTPEAERMLGESRSSKLHCSSVVCTPAWKRGSQRHSLLPLSW